MLPSWFAPRALAIGLAMTCIAPANYCPAESLLPHSLPIVCLDSLGLMSDLRARDSLSARGAGLFLPLDINSRGASVGVLDQHHYYLRPARGPSTVIAVPGYVVIGKAAITSNGAMMGQYLTKPDFIGHGFIREQNGTFTVFEIPGFQITDPRDMNAAGIVIGVYARGIEPAHGFLRDADGTVKTIDVPNVEASATFPEVISAGGTVAGEYPVPEDPDPTSFYFIRDPNGEYTTLKLQGGSAVTVTGINNAGDICGRFDDASGTHAFFRSPDGVVTKFDVDTGATVANGINDARTIVGSSGGHGYLREHDGTIIRFNVPGAKGSTADAINNAGTVTGRFWTFTSSEFFGYVRERTGEFTTFSRSDFSGGDLEPQARIPAQSSFQLGLDGFHPNPARGSCQIAFTLSNGAPAELEVYSVAGRRILACDLEAMGPGDHVLDLSTLQRPGVYWVRLSQGGKSITKKGVIIE